MIAWLEQFGPVTQALIATLFTWFVTHGSRPVPLSSR